MALSASTVWEIRPTVGAATNGGAFVTGASGTDFSQQNAAQYSLTGLSTSAANAVILSASAAADMVGNIIRINAGTNFLTGWYQILSVVVGVSITVDRTCTSAAGASGTAKIGGALDSIATLVGPFTVAGMTAWEKATGTDSIGSAVTFAQANGLRSVVSGYTTTRGDGGKATIQASAGSFVMITIPVSNAVVFQNFIIDGNAQTSSTGVVIDGNGPLMQNCKIMNCTDRGIRYAANSQVAQVNACEVTACLVGIDGQRGIYMNCWVHACTGTGVQGSYDGAIFLNCIISDNTGATTDGALVNAAAVQTAVIGCTIYGNGRDGIRVTGGNVAAVPIFNNVSYGNTGKDINNLGAAGQLIFENYNAFVTSTNVTAGPNDVTLSADPFVAKASNNFALNQTAGGGAACRDVGYPGVFPGAATTAYLDIGAAQTSSAIVDTNTVLPQSCASLNTAPTMQQAIYQIWSLLTQFAFSGTTLTTYKADGTTPAATYTLNSATAPTAITRAS